MTKANTFTFTSCHYEADTNTVLLSYAFDTGESFTETITFPGAKNAFTADEDYALEKTMNALHLAAGISYYKAFCPPHITIENQSITQNEADFFNKFYLLGLGEFSVENNLDLRKVISFPAARQETSKASLLSLSPLAVVPIGGGKDSLVSLEIVRKSDHSFRPIAVNAAAPILNVIKSAECFEAILIKRKIDPALFELNDKGAYNGHVPITGILSFVMALGAILYGYDTVVMSNERSANEGNMVQNGIDINHQYSKSLEFERDFSHYMTSHIMRNFKYFSLLRPLSESGIAALFSREPKYFSTFKSCNRNFHINEGERQYGWCCNCPKCRFVYLALAPFISRQKMIQIFGTDMLDDPDQEDGFKELLGLQGHKPFECVGEVGECRLLLKSLSIDPVWQDSYLVKKLSPRIGEEGLPTTELISHSLIKSPSHNLPADFERMLDAYIGS